MTLETSIGSYLARARSRRRRRAAQAWVVSLDAGALRERQRVRFQSWMGNPDNAEEFRRAARMWEDVDLLVTGHPSSIAVGRKRPSGKFWGTRRWLTVSSIAGLCLLTAWQADLWVILQADARTGTGERRVVRLADGSNITLDSGSAVSYLYDRGFRQVRLLEGRARFDVARDPGRPFLVEADGGTTRALGTSFIVDRTGTKTEVDAIVHDISVRKGEHEVFLRPGQSVRYEQGIGVVAPSRHGFDGWTSGVLTFNGARLGGIAAELQRYSTTRFIIIGSARNRSYSGVVRTGDVVAGLEALARSGGLTVRRFPGIVIITAR